jgi:hypothetical protein
VLKWVGSTSLNAVISCISVVLEQKNATCTYLLGYFYERDVVLNRLGDYHFDMHLLLAAERLLLDVAK